MDAGRVVLGVGAAGAVGWFAWSGSLWPLALTPLALVAALAQQSRASAGAVAFGYYGAASWPLIAAVEAFQGDSKSAALGTLLWFAASLLLSAPWIFAWSPRRRRLLWRAPLALLASAAPPLCIIGWASPLTVAGVLFPGSGWFGLAAAAVLPSLLAQPKARLAAVLATAIVSSAANLAYSSPEAPTGFLAVHTSFPYSPATGLDPIQWTGWLS